MEAEGAPKAKPVRLSTRWQVDEPIPLPEYPRPQLVRENWQNLNGWWKFAILPAEAGQPATWQGRIRVPYAPESALSGVGRVLQPGERLWYQRKFTVEAGAGERLLLHFGAVDHDCQVWLNGDLIGEHHGGYLPFSFDITNALDKAENEIVLAVQDASDSTSDQRGKQTLRPGGIWYTPVSGIWQTVWLELMPLEYLRSVRLTPALAGGTLTINADVATESGLDGLVVEAEARLDGQVVAEAEGAVGQDLVLGIPDARAWHPDHPTLYDLRLRLKRAGKVLDQVESYFAMRDYGRKRDVDGFWRFTLNGQPLFLFGPLDQGYYPDGLYTPPSEAAMLYDLEYAKRIGCNMVRKHVKVEPARWYATCDRLGLIVWQDFPNGGRVSAASVALNGFTTAFRRDDRQGYKRFGRENAANRTAFEAELREMVACLYSAPSVAAWVPFNESWGQFDAMRIASMVRALDPTRLVDHASGWFDQGGGDFNSQHIYFSRLKAPRLDHRLFVLSEFGGYSLKIAGHVWDENKKFGYRFFDTPAELTRAYLALLTEQVKPLIRQGLAAAIYTQTTDVETEINGYLTYDREVEKMDTNLLLQAHQDLIQSLSS